MREVVFVLLLHRLLFLFHFMSRLFRKQVSLSSEVTDYHFKNRCLPLYSEQGGGCGVSMKSRHGTFEDFHPNNFECFVA